MPVMRFPFACVLGALTLGLLGCSSDAKKGNDQPRAACLDEPGALDRPPEDGLPCELIPPGVELSE